MNVSSPWFGQVPDTWTVKRLKFVNEIIMGQSPESDTYNTEGEGEPFLQGNADFGLINPMPRISCTAVKKWAQKDDILLSVRAPIGAVNIADRNYGIGRGLCSVRAVKFHSKYLYYLLVSSEDELNSVGTGSTYTAVSTEQVGNLLVPEPPITTQNKIVKFLDAKTTRIDRAIDDYQQIVEHLEEERLAVINQAVTKGLDPHAPMKDSGVEWIGKVPKHWDVKKLKYVVSLVKHKATVEQDTKVIALEGIESWTGRQLPVENVLINEDQELMHYRKQDVLFNKLRPYLAKVHLAEDNGACVGELLVLRSGTQIIPPFLFYRVLSRDFIDIVNGSTYGVKMPRASWDFIAGLPIPLPSTDEQEEIVHHIDENCARIDATISKINKEIELLQEYRTALISEAVTGKIDVREVA